RSIKLGPCFASMVQLDLCHLSDHRRKVMARNCCRSRKFRVRTKGPHKRTPGKLTNRQCAYHTVGWRVERLDIGDVRCHLLLEKISNLMIKFGCLGLRCFDWSLCEQIAPHTKKSDKDKSDRSYDGEILFLHCKDSIYLRDYREADAVCWNRSIELMLHPKVVHAFGPRPRACNATASLCRQWRGRFVLFYPKQVLQQEILSVDQHRII